MIKTVTKIVVKGKSPIQIFDWIFNLNEERARQWHPTAHTGKGYIPPQGFKVGSVIYFEEIFDGVRVHYKWKVIELKENVSFLLKAKILYPVHLHISAKKIDNDTEITHELGIGFSFKGLEKIFDWFVRKFIFTKRKEEAMRQHATEEFKNLEDIL